MSVYNGGRFLAPAIESILDQTFEDFEFIIVDDGSEDGSSSIIAKYAEIDSRVVVISRENRGLVYSLNEAIGVAKAEFIARMDADDISLPDRFKKQITFLRENPHVVCVGGRPIVIDENSFELICFSVPLDSDFIEEQLLDGMCRLEHSATMYRRSTFQRVGGYREDYHPAEDLDLWLRMSEIGKIANLDEPVIKYRYVSTSISAQNPAKQLDATVRACKDAWCRRGLPDRTLSLGEWWRPNGSADSQYEFLMKFGWWGHNYGNDEAARLYALRALRLKPLRPAGWKLLYRAMTRSGRRADSDAAG
jgi:glycosyltransferase involved in cell wall biosynthesis